MFGKRLQELRDKKNMTQKQLADLVSLSQQTIDHYEKGRANPSVATITLLANIFGVSSDFLLGITSEPSPINANKDVEKTWPSTISVLRRAGRPPTPEEEERIARIIAAAIPDPENEKYHPKKKGSDGQ